MAQTEQDMMAGRIPDMPQERPGLSGAMRGPDLSRYSPEQIEEIIKKIAAQGTDGAIYQAMTLARQYGVRSPFDRAFQPPPATFGNLSGPTGRPRPLMRQPDMTGFSGGPDDPGRMPDTGMAQTYPEYEANYLQQYAPPRRR